MKTEKTSHCESRQAAGMLLVIVSMAMLVTIYVSSLLFFLEGIVYTIQGGYKTIPNTDHFLTASYILSQAILFLFGFDMFKRNGGVWK